MSIMQNNKTDAERFLLEAKDIYIWVSGGAEEKYAEVLYLLGAIKIASAHYLIMSLWRVPDSQTQVFMSAFYKHWLEDKMLVPEAFRATQLELRTKYGEAFKWAGFVLLE